MIWLALLAIAAPKVTPWPEADRLFRNAHWHGGDAAYSIALANDRTLWLFGDSFVGGPTRAEATFVHNTTALQVGRDPTTASITFASTERFVTGTRDTWYWPLHGIALGRGAAVFVQEVRKTGNGALDFQVIRSRLALIDDIDAWKVRYVDTEPVFGRVIMGTAIAREGASIFILGREPDGSGILVEISNDALATGELTQARHWDGERWRHAQSPAHIFAQTGAEACLVKTGKLWRHIYSQPFGPIVMQEAPRVTGPWTAPVVIFTPPTREGVFSYAAKAHPQLHTRGGLAITYVTNALEPSEVLADTTIYLPRFLRLR